MNAFGGAGPQEYDDNGNTAVWVGSTPEMDLLLERFVDPFKFLSENAPPPPYCSNKRIDFVLAQGQYTPEKYEACFDADDPSDHPFVIVTFEAGDPRP